MPFVIPTPLPYSSSPSPHPWSVQKAPCRRPCRNIAPLKVFTHHCQINRAYIQGSPQYLSLKILYSCVLFTNKNSISCASIFFPFCRNVIPFYPKPTSSSSHLWAHLSPHNLASCLHPSPYSSWPFHLCSPKSLPYLPPHWDHLVASMACLAPLFHPASQSCLTVKTPCPLLELFLHFLSWKL